MPMTPWEGVMLASSFHYKSRRVVSCTGWSQLVQVSGSGHWGWGGCKRDLFKGRGRVIGGCSREQELEVGLGPCICSGSKCISWPPWSSPSLLWYAWLWGDRVSLIGAAAALPGGRRKVSHGSTAEAWTLHWIQHRPAGLSFPAEVSMTLSTYKVLFRRSIQSGVHSCLTTTVQVTKHYTKITAQ